MITREVTCAFNTSCYNPEGSWMEAEGEADLFIYEEPTTWDDPGCMDIDVDHSTVEINVGVGWTDGDGEEHELEFTLFGEEVESFLNAWGTTVEDCCDLEFGL